ncbi:MAG: hypothetical protein V2J19_06510 [Wenzhouxiangella sp.]|jgi:hypothetical protein|nr:hypothetical protein [Wenzhouxiangella sp.]
MPRPEWLNTRLTALSVVFAMAVAFAPRALADLAAVAVDLADNSLRVVEIDSVSGSITPGSAAIADCCRIGGGLTAADADGQQFFAFGLDVTTDVGVLATLSFDGNSVSTIAPARAPQVLLAHDGAQDRLISVQLLGDASTPSLQWFAIDPATGSVADIGTADATCCELMTGVADVDESAQRLFFAGREFGQPDWRIRSVDLATGTVSDVAALPAPGSPAFIRFDNAGGYLDVYMQDGPDGVDDGFYRVNPSTGAGVLVAAEDDADCCLLGLGHSASRDAAGESWWMAGSGNGMTTVPGIMALFAETANAAVSQWETDPGYALHALIVAGTVVSPGTIFRDRFEAPEL